MHARWILGVALSVSACACTASNQCDVGSSGGLVITSSTANLVSASGCGNITTCRYQTPCPTLVLAAPADGGTCEVTVTFANGSDDTVVADWGAVHDAACGPFYDQTPHVTFGSDAGSD